MDILAHAIWANLGARKADEILRKKDRREFSVLWATFWGVFPDLFAFSIPFAVRLYSVMFGSLAFSNFFVRPPIAEEGALSNGFALAPHLYPFSHSLIIFSIVLIGAWLIWRRPRYELLGWALHIFIDIFSHSAAFFPTPFLFPISDWKFLHGIAWSNKWFMITNYATIFFVWVVMLFKKYFKK